MVQPKQPDTGQRTAVAPARKKQPRKRLPPKLSQAITLHDNRLILAAYWQFFQERMQEKVPKAYPAFFELIALIYAASHDDIDLLPPLARSSLPGASLSTAKISTDAPQPVPGTEQDNLAWVG